MAGNAQVGMGTFTSILIGTLNGSLAGELRGRRAVSWRCRHYAGLNRLARQLRDSRCAIRGWEIFPISLNPIADAAGNIRLARKSMTVFYCIMGISWFWLFGGSFLTQVPNFAVTVLQGHASLISVLLGCLYCGGSDWLTALRQNIRPPG